MRGQVGKKNRKKGWNPFPFVKRNPALWRGATPPEQILNAGPLDQVFSKLTLMIFFDLNDYQSLHQFLSHNSWSKTDNRQLPQPQQPLLKQIVGEGSFSSLSI
jgi:hypothetical protein